MTRIFRASLSLFAAALLLMAQPSAAFAQEFAKPSMDNITKTLIRLGAFEVDTDDVIDLYARMLHCDIVQLKYKNDFEWQKIRAAMREEIRQNIHAFPVGYAYETAVKLGHYDFDRKLYTFEGKGGEINVNTFTMQTADKNFCTTVKENWMPTSYQMVLNKPVKIPGLFLPEAEAKALRERLSVASRDYHLIYMRVNLRVVFIAQIVSDADLKAARKKNYGVERYMRMQSKIAQSIRNGSIRLDSELDSIEFFEDSAYQKVIYTYRPYEH